MKKIVIFAGTTEGRRIAEALRGRAEIRCHVATDYGREEAPEEGEGLTVCQGRLDENEIEEMLKREKPCICADCTHPYAEIITENIRNACEETGTEYMRVVRDVTEMAGKITRVGSIGEAASYLAGKKGNILLTTGSKELEPFTAIEDYGERVFPRVLPSEWAVGRCVELGFSGRNIIAMQGPFSVEMNTALIHMTGAAFLVTKDGGKAGGCPEKIAAAEACGIETVLVGRHGREEGISEEKALCEILKRIGEETDGAGQDKSDEGKRWLPVFADSEEMKILIAGGGKIGGRRAETLSRFRCDITLAADRPGDRVLKLAEEGKISLIRRKFRDGDLEGADMVIAATDDSEENRRIALLGKEKGIWYNCASDRNLCSFHFPAVAIEGDVTCAVTCQGNDHRKTAETRKLIEELLKNRK